MSNNQVCDKVYNALNVGDTTTIDGVKVMRVEGDISPGDMYLAERNTGIHLLIADYIHERGWIVPQDKFKYCYNVPECIKVVKV